MPVGPIGAETIMPMMKPFRSSWKVLMNGAKISITDREYKEIYTKVRLVGGINKRIRTEVALILEFTV
ncbi:MAG: hypothetical protein IJ816_00615 [Alloprevotella sp.]|nr:hypothetical protein [Alloprevotella sp.]